MFKIYVKKLTLCAKHKYSTEDILTILRSYKYIKDVFKKQVVLRNASGRVHMCLYNVINIFMCSFTPITIGKIPSSVNFSGSRYRLVATMFTDSVFLSMTPLLVIDSGRQLTNSTSVDCVFSFRKDFYLYYKA